MAAETTAGSENEPKATRSMSTHTETKSEEKPIYWPSIPPRSESASAFVVFKRHVPSRCDNGKCVSHSITKLFRCTGCGNAWYCSVACQSADYTTHRPICIRTFPRPPIIETSVDEEKTTHEEKKKKKKKAKNKKRLTPITND